MLIIIGTGSATLQPLGLTTGTSGCRQPWCLASTGISSTTSDAQYSRRLLITWPSKTSGATSRIRLRMCCTRSSNSASHVDVPDLTNLLLGQRHQDSSTTAANPSPRPPSTAAAALSGSPGQPFPQRPPAHENQAAALRCGTGGRGDGRAPRRRRWRRGRVPRGALLSELLAAERHAPVHGKEPDARTARRLHHLARWIRGRRGLARLVGPGRARVPRLVGRGPGSGLHGPDGRQHLSGHVRAGQRR